MQRADLYVIARFLDVLHNEGSLKKTSLQMAVGLNYLAFLRYCEWLSEKKLIEFVRDDEGNERIRLSSKGKEAYERFVSWLTEIVGDLKKIRDFHR